MDRGAMCYNAVERAPPIKISKWNDAAILGCFYTVIRVAASLMC